MDFLLIAFCLFAGIFLRTFKILSPDAHKGINVWILYVAFPAVALHYIPAIEWKLELLLPLAMPFIVLFGAWLTLKIFSSSYTLDANTYGALLLTAGLGNTSFVGFPLTQAYWGNEGLRIAVICDQLSFIALSTFGVISAMHNAHSGNADIRKIISGLIKFPPFVSFISALFLPHIIPLTAFDSLLQKLAGTLVPLALFSAGMQIQLSEWSGEIKYLFLGLGYKLFIAPAIIFGIAAIFGIKGIIAQASIFEAAMAPSITAAIIAGQYELNPKLASLMASIGIFVSFLTTLLWWLLSR
jgi:malate permease and related proteins